MPRFLIFTNEISVPTTRCSAHPRRNNVRPDEKACAHRIRHLLAELKLKTALDRLDELMTKALRDSMTPALFLQQLLTLEVDALRERASSAVYAKPVYPNGNASTILISISKRESMSGRS